MDSERDDALLIAGRLERRAEEIARCIVVLRREEASLRHRALMLRERERLEKDGGE